jgi:hypothetical protein
MIERPYLGNYPRQVRMVLSQIRDEFRLRAGGCRDQGAGTGDGLRNAPEEGRVHRRMTTWMTLATSVASNSNTRASR